MTPQAVQGPDPAFVDMTRRRLRAKLTLVQAAEVMPWPNLLTIIHEDNDFRFSKDILPPDEGAALWAAFDKEMDRLYLIMNGGEVVDTLAELDASD